MGPAPGGDASRQEQLETTLQLLRRAFDSTRFRDTRCIEWVYDHNPDGPALEENLDDDHGRRIGHIAAIPRHCRDAEHTDVFMLLYNVATDPTAQRRGIYVQLCQQLYPKIYGKAGGFLGVPNAKSLSPDVRALDARHLGDLPARVVIPRTLRTAGVESHVVDRTFADSPRFAELLGDADDVPAAGWVHSWPLDVLRWRLLWPHNLYTVHADDDVVAVSTLGTKFGMRFAVICKLLPRHGRAGPIDPKKVIAAACKHHRAPLALYAGFNAHVPVKGILLPNDRLPSPLSVVILSTSDRIDQNDFALDTFEFLDFDAF